MLAMSKNQRAKVENEIKILAEEAIQKQTMQIIRRYTKTMCIALNEKYGFGTKRLCELIGTVGDISKISDYDEEYWSHIDKRLVEQLKVPFETEAEVIKK